MTGRHPLRLLQTTAPSPRSEHSRSASAWVVVEHRDGSRECCLVSQADVLRFSLPFSPELVRCGYDGALWAIEAQTQDVWVEPCGGSWRRFGTRAKRIAAGPTGVAFLTTEDGSLVRVDVRGNYEKQRLSPNTRARDAAITANGDVWLVTDFRVNASGYAVQRRPARSEDWYDLPQPATAEVLSASPEGYAWAVNGHGAIWVLHPEGAGHMRGCTLDPTCRRCRRSDGAWHFTDVSVGSTRIAWAMTAGAEREVHVRDEELMTGFQPLGVPGRPLSLAASFRDVPPPHPASENAS